MTRRMMILLLAGAIFLVSGCAGKDFVRLKPDALVLGKTSYEEIIRQFGDPYRKGSSLKEGQTVTSIAYAYASATGTSRFGGVTPARSMGFYFVENILVGYEFTSSYKDDLTDFDETKVAEIRKGDTKRAEVERLFGQAGGLYTYPLIKTKRENALVYLYSQTRSAPFSVKMYLKKLVVTVDETGTVTDVEFNTSGEK